MQNRLFHIEAEVCQERKYKERVCGDACATKIHKEEERLITVLSDGLGSGVKANVLATMTTSMALQFTANKNPMERTAEFIMSTLPVDSKRQISYSTFTIMDINCQGLASFIEYDNPEILIFRNGGYITPQKRNNIFPVKSNNEAKVSTSSIQLQKEDRIIMTTDGVTQAGMGSDKHPFGWTNEGLKSFVQQTINSNANISAAQLSRQIVERAKAIDAGTHKDDTTCMVIYCREPRKILIASGPPYHKQYDKQLADRTISFAGKKVICGGTTSTIIGRELNRTIDVDLQSSLDGLPPRAYMEGIDLITEGILTLGRVSTILENIKDYQPTQNDTAYKLVDLLINSDAILILAGTKINNAHQDPSLPQELEIRRNVIKKIAFLLETQFLKSVEIEYL